jgi:hypothetical protein
MPDWDALDDDLEGADALELGDELESESLSTFEMDATDALDADLPEADRVAALRRAIEAIVAGGAEPEPLGDLEL